VYTVFQKKTPIHIVGYKLRNICLILIIFDIKNSWHNLTSHGPLPKLLWADLFN